MARDPVGTVTRRVVAGSGAGAVEIVVIAVEDSHSGRRRAAWRCAGAAVAVAAMVTLGSALRNDDVSVLSENLTRPRSFTETAAANPPTSAPATSTTEVPEILDEPLGGEVPPEDLVAINSDGVLTEPGSEAADVQAVTTAPTVPARAPKQRRPSAPPPPTFPAPTFPAPTFAAPSPPAPVWNVGPAEVPASARTTAAAPSATTAAPRTTPAPRTTAPLRTTAPAATAPPAAPVTAPVAPRFDPVDPVVSPTP